MKRIGIIAAGGESRRTGLGAYTSKAALPLRGKSLLAHQIDFLRRSDFDGAFVIARCEHVGLLSRILSRADRTFVSFIASDCATGWAGEVERAARFIDDSDEVLLVSCDNDHDGVTASHLVDTDDAFFTFTMWSRTDRAPTDGTVLARFGESAWTVRPGPGFVGEFFSGYANFRGSILKEHLAKLPVVEGKKELTALLALLNRAHYAAHPYAGDYEDVSDLRALALLNAGKSCWSNERVDIGAGVLLHDSEGRVLLAERQDGLGWTIPGGHVDSGEAYAHAAVRELEEETGWRIDEDDLRLLGVYPCTGKTGNPAASVIFHGRLEDSVLYGVADRREVGAVAITRAYERLPIPFNLRTAVDDWFAGRELDVR